MAELTMAFSEAKRPYSGGTSFTGGGVISPAPKALRIDYRGNATNAANNLNGDRMMTWTGCMWRLKIQRVM